MFTRGFQSRRSQSESMRLPPGQHVTGDFPVLSAGTAPHTSLHAWSFALEAEDGTNLMSWNWEEFRALGPTEVGSGSVRPYPGVKMTGEGRWCPAADNFFSWPGPRSG